MRKTVQIFLSLFILSFFSVPAFAETKVLSSAQAICAEFGAEICELSGSELTLSSPETINITQAFEIKTSDSLTINLKTKLNFSEPLLINNTTLVVNDLTDDSDPTITANFATRNLFNPLIISEESNLTFNNLKLETSDSVTVFDLGANETLTINGGTYKTGSFANLRSSTIIFNNPSVTVANSLINDLCLSSETKVEINGGTYLGSSDDGLLWTSLGCKNLTISAGTFESTSSAETPSIFNVDISDETTEAEIKAEIESYLAPSSYIYDLEHESETISYGFKKFMSDKAVQGYWDAGDLFSNKIIILEDGGRGEVETEETSETEENPNTLDSLPLYSLLFICSLFALLLVEKSRYL